jgi:hypothetical protein
MSFTDKERDEKLAKLGWTVVCESPLEMEHFEGSFASGLAASIVIDELMLNFEDYYEEE